MSQHIKNQGNKAIKEKDNTEIRFPGSPQETDPIKASGKTENIKNDKKITGKSPSKK